MGPSVTFRTTGSGPDRITMSPANFAPSTGSPPTGARGFGLRDLGLTCERIGSEAVGFGTVAWLRISPGKADLRTLTAPGPEGKEGEDARALHIGETGQVPELQVENRGGWPLLLPAHLVL